MVGKPTVDIWHFKWLQTSPVIAVVPGQKFWKGIIRFFPAF